MADGTDFWRNAALAASRVPATGVEEATWIARNLTELALMLELEDGPITALDHVVATGRLDMADRRLMERLRVLRERRGPVPESYPQGIAVAEVDDPPAPSDDAAASIVIAFAEQLADTFVDSDEPVPARGAAAAAAIAGRDAWRPFPRPRRPHRLVETDIPADVVWRSWWRMADGTVIRVMYDSAMTPTEMDVSLGVHDAIHLDHLACFDRGTEPTPIEFGTGLLIAEAVAMAAEILAGAEALAQGDAGAQCYVRRFLIRRASRLPGCSDLAHRYAAGSDDGEFNALPTFARAYVAGPLRLIAARFADCLVPPEATAAFRARWRRAATTSAAVAALERAACEWVAAYGSGDAALVSRT